MLTALFRRYVFPYKSDILAVFVLQLIQSLAALALPRLNGDIINFGVLQGDNAYIWRHGGLMLLLAFVQVIFNIGAVFFGARIAARFGRETRAALFGRVLSYSSQEVDGFGSASLITRITNDVTQVQTLVVMMFTLALAAPITMIGGVIMAVQTDTGLSLVLTVSIPILAGFAGVLISRMIPLFRRMQEQIDSLNRVLREQLAGLRVVRAFVREDYETEKFERANDELTDTSLQAGRLMAFLFPTITTVLNLSSVAAVWVGASRIEAGTMKIGALIAFLTYLVQILMSVMMASFLALMVPRASVSAERIAEVLDTSPAMKEPDQPHQLPEAIRRIDIDAMSFQYPGAESPVLSDIDIHLERGDVMAIVGSTGAGKTTLLQLVPRLIEPTSGVIRVDGVPLDELALEALWNRIGYVPQRAYLFSGTIRSNLLFSHPDATEDEMWAALETAQAAAFVRELPDGLDAAITQGGTNLSGGQRQRLSIARAIVRQPELLLLDDSFSALDLLTESRVRAALAPLMQQAITLVVAQRVSTVEHATSILVLEDGEAVGYGTHAELLETCSTYQEIIASQANAAELT